ncbi:MAG: hypothetical protein GYA46_03865 [candidate division Zixibacteria bacterium]|nr:hypothetical protein [candidate division Zixibacteria bacterium]
MSNRFYRRAVVTAAIFAVMIGCSDDASPVKSPIVEEDYQLTLSYYYPDASPRVPYFLVVEGPADAIVDSIAFQEPFDAFRFLENGTTAVYTRGKKTWTASWPGGIVSADASTGGSVIHITPDEQYLFVTGGKPALFSLPDLGALYLAGSGGDGTLIPHRRLACYHNWGDTLHYLDFSTGTVVHEKRALRGKSGEVLNFETVCASVSGDSLILSAQRQNGDVLEHYLIVAATADLQVLDQTPITVSFQFTRPVVHPDGRRVYWCYEGTTWNEIVYGSVFVYDITTKTLTLLVDGADYGLFPHQMALSPAGNYLYVLSINDLNLAKVRLADGTVMEPIDYLPGRGECMALRPAGE